MNQTVVNTTPFLRTSREFPFDDIKQLAFEVNKAYVDTANAVNNRTISIFPSNRTAITGENWFISQNLRQQSLRQVYTFTSTSDIAHNIPLTDVSYFVRGFGDFLATNGNWYGLIFGGNAAIANQISFYITPSTATVSGNIKFFVGAGAPTLTKGIIVLEWISQA